MNDQNNINDTLCKEPADRDRKAAPAKAGKAFRCPSDELPRANGDLFRPLVDQMTDSLIIIDRDGAIRFANTAALLLVEVASDTEAVGRSIIEFIAPESLPAVMEGLRQVMSGRKRIKVECGILTAKGCNRWVEAIGTKVRYEGADCDMVNIRDITGRRQTEEALKASEKRYYQLFENMLDGMAHCRMVFDEEGRPVDFVYNLVNSAFERLTGLKDVEGRRVTEVIPLIREQSPEVLEIYGRVARTGRPEQFELLFNPLNIWLRISVYSPEEGSFVAVFENVTERRQVDVEREKLIGELQQALAEVKTLSGLLPICSSCKKIRNDEGYWERIEKYISDRSGALFSHGLCPECVRKLYPDLREKK
ncbi:MAG: PAS domain-containing protein [Smithellaceae bacterium]|nr:PAS domain-containing protein [Smithellaceae bacterium]